MTVLSETSVGTDMGPSMGSLWCFHCLGVSDLLLFIGLATRLTNRPLILSFNWFIPFKSYRGKQ